MLFQIHSTLHTGEKNHMCPTCGKAFRVRANYYKHRKIHERTSIEQHQQEQQELGEPVQEQQEAPHAEIQPVSNEVSNVSVTLPSSTAGLLETFSVSLFFFFFSKIIYYFSLVVLKTKVIFIIIFLARNYSCTASSCNNHEYGVKCPWAYECSWNQYYIGRRSASFPFYSSSFNKCQRVLRNV